MTTNLIYRYKIYCITSNQLETAWSLTPLTVCPVNAGHIVNTDSNTGSFDTVVYTTFTGPVYKNAVSDFMLCDTTLGNVVIKLPQASLGNIGNFRFQKTSVNNSVIILPNNTDTINGASYVTLLSNSETIIITSNGINWVSVSVNDDDGTNIDIDDFLTNKTLLQYQYNVPTAENYITPSGITGSIQLYDGIDNMSGSTLLYFSNNDLVFGGDADKRIVIDRQIDVGATGKNLTIQAGGVAVGAIDKAGGNLILRPGIATGKGGTGGLGATGINQQSGLITMASPLLGITGSVDADFISTRINVPVRICQNGSFDIIRIDFTPNLNTACAFNIYLSIICADIATEARTVSSSRTVVLRQVANTITNATGAMFTDVRLGTALPAVAWSIITGTNRAFVRVTITNLLTTNLTFNYFSMVVDNMLYNPVNTTIQLPFV
jgi:hypothetical protein